MKRVAGAAKQGLTKPLFCASGLLLAAACTGQIGAGADGVGNGSASDGSGGVPSGSNPTRQTTEAACAERAGELDVGLTKLRRLTRDQLDNTLRDLVGLDQGYADAISPDERMGPFHSNAIAPITELVVQQHQELAVRVATDAQPRMVEIAPCDLSADTGATCATQFVTQFGSRALRRPLTVDEISGLVELYSLGYQAAGAEHGFRLVVEAILQAPSFIYHADTGASGVAAIEPVVLGAYPLASRLSYFLWNSMPDDELFDRAADASLLDDAVFSGQVQRMLQSPKAAETLALFHRQWLGVSDLLEQERDQALFPSFDAELAEEMLAEQARFVQHVLLRGDATLSSLLTANYTFPSAGLFDLYGMPAPDDFVIGDQVSLPTGQRAGLLTQAAFVARHAKRGETSPVHRGILVREHILCETIQPPPPTVDTVLPPATEATTTRERFEQHQSDPTCAACHRLMDPIGLGFEHYDAIGQYRTQEGNQPVDASGEIVSEHADLAGEFDGAVELAAQLAASSVVGECVARQWFRFALGRIESDSDACAMIEIFDSLEASGGDVRALITQIALSDSFRHVRSIGQETTP